MCSDLAYLLGVIAFNVFEKLFKVSSHTSVCGTSIVEKCLDFSLFRQIDLIVTRKC